MSGDMNFSKTLEDMQNMQKMVQFVVGGGPAGFLNQQGGGGGQFGANQGGFGGGYGGAGGMRKPFNMRMATCYKCGRRGHIASQCPDLDKEEADPASSL